MDGRFSCSAWIVEGLIDDGYGLMPLALAMTSERVLCLLRIPPPLVAPMPGDDLVEIVGTVVEGKTEYSPAVVLCERIGGVSGRARLAVPSVLAGPWLMDPDARLNLLSRLTKTPLRHFGNRCHDILRGVTRSIAWDGNARSLLVSRQNGASALAAVAEFANTFGQGAGASAHQAAVRLGEIMPPSRASRGPEGRRDISISPVEAELIAAFEIADTDSDNQEVPVSGASRPGGGNRGGAPSRGGRSVFVTRAGQLSGPDDVARIIRDMQADRSEGVGPLWDETTLEEQDGFPSGDVAPGIDVDAFTDMENAGRAGGEDGMSRSTTDRKRKGAYRQRGVANPARPRAATTPRRRFSAPKPRGPR